MARWLRGWTYQNTRQQRHYMKLLKSCKTSTSKNIEVEKGEGHQLSVPVISSVFINGGDMLIC